MPNSPSLLSSGPDRRTVRNRLARLTPWRVRRWAERAALSSMRFVPAGDTLEVSGAEPAASLIATGDIMLSAATDAAFDSMAPALEQADLRVGNLESVLTTAQRPAGSLGSFLKAPPAAAALLARARFDAVTIANNHALDFGLPALLESLDILDRHAIRPCGAGAGLAAARAPALMETHGLRVGMLGYSDDYRAAATATTGLLPVAAATDELILEDLAALRPKVDFLVLQLHWGYEFALYPLLSHRDRARRFAAAGADLVLCHHAHVPMGLEVFEGRLIAHGLGNFLFGHSDYVSQGHPWTSRSFALQVWFGPSGVSRARILPCEVAPGGSVLPLAGPRRASMLGAVRVLSRRLLQSERLASLERDRILRETLRFLDVFRQCGSDDPDRATKWAFFLRTPRQRSLIAALTAGGELTRPIGEFLAQVAESAGAPEQTAALAAAARRDPLRRSIAHLESAAALADDLPGRTP